MYGVKSRYGSKLISAGDYVSEEIYGHPIYVSTGRYTGVQEGYMGVQVGDMWENMGIYGSTEDVR